MNMQPISVVLSVPIPEDLIKTLESMIQTSVVKAVTEALASKPPARPPAAIGTDVELTEKDRSQAAALIGSASAVKLQADAGGLIDMATLAKLIAIGERTVWRMLSMGAIPAPVRLGHKIVRWRADEIREWIETGCPQQETWEKIRDRRFQVWPPKKRGGR